MAGNYQLTIRVDGVNHYIPLPEKGPVVAEAVLECEMHGEAAPPLYILIPSDRSGIRVLE